MLVQRQIPISEQIVLVLQKWILEGRYTQGNRLPSEGQLAQDFRVSRGSIRTALAKLERAGMIVRRQGGGTYVSQLGANTTAILGAIWRFDHLIEITGRRPHVEALSYVERVAASEEAVGLNLGRNERVVQATRRHLADGFPVALTLDAFPRSLFQVPIAQVNFGLRIDRVFRDYCDEEIAYTSAKIEAILAEPEIADKLSLEPGEPVLRLIDVFFNRAEGRPILYSTAYVNTRELSMYQVRPWD